MERVQRRGDNIPYLFFVFFSLWEFTVYQPDVRAAEMLVSGCSSQWEALCRGGRLSCQISWASLCEDEHLQRLGQ